MSNIEIQHTRIALWVTTGYPWSADWVQGVFHQTAVRALQHAGVSVRVAAVVPRTPWPLPLVNTRWARYAAVPPEYVDSGIPIIRPRYLAVPGLPSWSRPERSIANAVLGSLGHSADVGLVHSHYAFPMAPAGRAIARRLHVPHVVTVHGDDINTWPAEHPRQLPGVVAALLAADALVAVSDALAERTAAVCGRRPETIPIGIDIEAFTRSLPDRSSARAQLGIDDGRFVALYVGLLSRAKGSYLFADAVNASPKDVLGVVIGEGPGAGYGTDAGRRRLRYVGVQPRAGVALYMRAADVVVLPSQNEGLPTVLVEAGAVGTPVIASRAGGIPELLADGRGVVVDELTAAAFSAAVCDAIVDPGALLQRSRSLQAHVRTEYDAGMNARRLAAIYGRLM